MWYLNWNLSDKKDPALLELLGQKEPRVQRGWCLKKCRKVTRQLEHSKQGGEWCKTRSEGRQGQIVLDYEGQGEESGISWEWWEAMGQGVSKGRSWRDWHRQNIPLTTVGREETVRSVQLIAAGATGRVPCPRRGTSARSSSSASPGTGPHDNTCQLRDTTGRTPNHPGCILAKMLNLNLIIRKQQNWSRVMGILQNRRTGLFKKKNLKILEDSSRK